LCVSVGDKVRYLYKVLIAQIIGKVNLQLLKPILNNGNEFLGKYKMFVKIRNLKSVS